MAETRQEYIRFHQTFESGVCWGSIGSIQETTRYVDENDRRFFRICAPSKSTLVQMTKVFAAYIDTHPEKLHWDGSMWL